jgi:hypothetical protein
LSRVITGDDGSIEWYDLETERRSAQWESPNSARQKEGSTVKSKLVTSFDVKGIVLQELVPAGQTVKSAF